MRVFPVVTAIISMLLMFAVLVASPLDEPAVSTGLFNMPMQEISQRRQPQFPAADETPQGTASEIAPGDRPFQPGEIRDNVARVTELNTRWDESRLSLVTSFNLPATPSQGAVIVGSSPAEMLVQKWIDIA